MVDFSEKVSPRCWTQIFDHEDKLIRNLLFKIDGGDNDHLDITDSHILFNSSERENHSDEYCLGWLTV